MKLPDSGLRESNPTALRKAVLDEGSGSVIALTDELEKLAAGMRGWTRQLSLRLHAPDFSKLELATTPCWVAWREEEGRAGGARDAGAEPKGRKVPYDPNRLSKARSNDPDTWGTRAQAERAARRLLAKGQTGGVGIQLGLRPEYWGMALCGLDLDSCRDPETRRIEPWAVEILKRFRSRTEVSPGRRGLKVFFLLSREDWQSIRHRTGSKARVAWSRGDHCELALDLERRYYTVTDGIVASQPEELSVVSLADLLWLVDDAGPEFLEQGRSAPAHAQRGNAGKDESGSGHGYRYLLRKAWDRCTKEQAIAELLEDEGPAGEWARRTDDRQHRRAWQKASEQAELDAQQIGAIFDDDEEPDPGRGSVDPVVSRLNERHALVVIKGKSLISTLKDDGSIDFGTIRDLDALYANQVVPCGDRKTEPASRRWFRSPHRRTYANGVGIYFDDPPARTLNLWTGWAEEPDPTASCEQFLWHLRHVICADDAEQYAYLLGWMAHMVQHPSEKPEVAVIIRGPKGAGKDTVAEYLARFIGRRHAPTVAQISHITGKFNAHLEACLLLQIQEGIWAGNRDGESVLKYLISSEQVAIERKGMDSYQLPSFLRVFISANADWVVPASADERRFAVFEASGAKRGDGSYFRELRNEMKGDGPAALLHLLQSHDLRDFDVRQPPASVGLRKQKVESLRGFDRWWFETLLEASLEGDQDWGSVPVTLCCDDLRSAYTRWIARHRFEGDPINASLFGERLRKVIPDLKKHRPVVNGKRVWCYEIPVLGACRDRFQDELGVCGFAWDD